MRHLDPLDDVRDERGLACGVVPPARSGKSRGRSHGWREGAQEEQGQDPQRQDGEDGQLASHRTTIPPPGSVRGAV